jgi:uncharacterized membrane protein YdjX (TVP38/TMEM64 family)
MKDAVWANCLMNNLPIEQPSVDTGASENKDGAERKPIRELLIGGVGFLLFMTILTVGINRIGVETLQQFIRDAGVFAPLIYIGMKMLTYIVAPLTSGPIQVIAGTLFGSVELGILYTLMGEVLGGSISFWIARRFGHPVVSRFVGKNGMAQVESFYQDRLGGWVALAAARIILFSVWDILSYALGLAKPVRYSTYLFVSVVFGFFPTWLFVWLGNRAIQDRQAMFMVYIMVGILILLPIIARRRVERLLAWASGRKVG